MLGQNGDLIHTLDFQMAPGDTTVGSTPISKNRLTLNTIVFTIGLYEI